MNEKAALLVIDVQNSATARDGKVTVGCERCDAPIENMNSLIELADRESWDIYYVAHVTPWYHFLPAAATHFAFMKGSEGARFDRRTAEACAQMGARGILIARTSDLFPATAPAEN